MKKVNSIKISAVQLLKKNWSRILYYGGVALVLCAVAYAAEQYRSDDAREELVLPAVDIAESVAEVEKFALLVPENATLSRDYSAEPAWNADLELWETHTGQDYALSNGEATAFCDGEVIEIGSDGRNGGYVAIVCGNMLIRYGSIAPNSGLEAGDRVKFGDVIGSADGSMSSESCAEPHLHFELLLNGEAVDPSPYMQEKTLESVKKASNS